MIVVATDVFLFEILYETSGCVCMTHIVNGGNNSNMSRALVAVLFTKSPRASVIACHRLNV